MPQFGETLAREMQSTSIVAVVPVREGLYTIYEIFAFQDGQSTNCRLKFAPTEQGEPEDDNGPRNKQECRFINMYGGYGDGYVRGSSGKATRLWESSRSECGGGSKVYAS